MDSNISVQTVSQPICANIENESTAQSKATLLLKISAIAIPLLSFLASNLPMIVMAPMAGEISGIGIAHMFGTFLFPLIVVLVFQIGKRFRNSRSRWSIYLCAGLFSLSVNVLAAISDTIAKIG